MSDATTAPIAVPVLFVTEPIVLPGMVVPIELDEAARAAVDAAQAAAAAGEAGKLLIAPRLDDRYPTHGVLASIVQVGRVPSGGTAAVVRGERRAHIGSGTSGLVNSFSTAAVSSTRFARKRYFAALVFR